MNPNVQVMSREQKKENFQFQAENKRQFTQFFLERFSGFWSSFQHKTISENTFWSVYFLLQNLIFAIFSFICGSRKFNHDQKNLLSTLVLSYLEGFMSLTKHPLVSVSQTSIGFLKKLLVFQKIENRLCTRSFGTPFTVLLNGYSRLFHIHCS